MIKQTETSWFSATSALGIDANFLCASCQEHIDIGRPSCDHHPQICPACGIACLYISGTATNFQILPELAPAPLRAAIRWAQENLDEIEFVELMVALEELTGKIPEQAG